MQLPIVASSDNQFMYFTVYCSILLNCTKGLSESWFAERENNHKCNCEFLTILAARWQLKWWCGGLCRGARRCDRPSVIKSTGGGHLKLQTTVAVQLAFTRMAPKHKAIREKEQKCPCDCAVRATGHCAPPNGQHRRGIIESIWAVKQ